MKSSLSSPKHSSTSPLGQALQEHPRQLGLRVVEGGGHLAILTRNTVPVNALDKDVSADSDL